ncbi:MAG: J domain-containing protein [Nocardioides sp.]
MNRVNPSLYDLLDVDQTATDTEIRAAWKSAIADLDPSDRRFRAYNQAAEVLLDPQQRAAYDADLAAPEATQPASVAEAPSSPAPPAREPSRPGLPAVISERVSRFRARRSTGEPAGEKRPATAASPGRTWQPPGWLLIGLAVLTLAVIAFAGYLATRPSDSEVEESTREAQSAAERAIVPILSYDHRTLEDDQSEAQSFMTSDYRKEYDKLFKLLEQNAPATETVVDAEVIASALVRSATESERAEILMFVNRPTTNKQNKEPVVYKDQVTVTMEKVGEDWLVDELKTSPAAR